MIPDRIHQDRVHCLAVMRFEKPRRRERSDTYQLRASVYGWLARARVARRTEVSGLAFSNLRDRP